MDRPSVSHRPVFIGLAVSLVLAAAFALFVYYKFIRYQPRAESFLPARAQLTAWVQMEQAVVYEPFRQQFFPLLEVGRQGPESRLLHLERKTTLELGVDTRELALAFLPDGGFAVILGGLYRPDKVAEGVVRLLDEEGVDAELVRSGLARIGPRAYLGTEAAGLLRVASDPGLVSGSPERIVQSAKGVAVRIQFFARPEDGPARDGAHLPDIALGVGLAADFPFELTLSPEMGSPESLGPSLHRLWTLDRPLLDSALARARTTRDGRGFVLTGELGREGFSELLEELCAQLKLRATPAFDR